MENFKCNNLIKQNQRALMNQLHEETGVGLFTCKKALENADWSINLARIILTIRGPIQRMVTIKARGEDEIPLVDLLADETGWPLYDCHKILNGVGMQYYDDIVKFAKKHPDGLNSVL